MCTVVYGIADTSVMAQRGSSVGPWSWCRMWVMLSLPPMRAAEPRMIWPNFLPPPSRTIINDVQAITTQAI